MCKAAWDRWAKLVMPEPIRAGPVAALLRVLGEGEYGTHKLMRLGFVDVQYEEDGLQGHGNCWEEVNVEESADVDRYGDLEQQAHVFKPKAHSLEAEVDFDEDGDAEEYADVEANAGIEEAA